MFMLAAYRATDFVKSSLYTIRYIRMYRESSYYVGSVRYFAFDRRHICIDNCSAILDWDVPCCKIAILSRPASKWVVWGLLESSGYVRTIRLLPSFQKLIQKDS